MNKKPFILIAALAILWIVPYRAAASLAVMPGHSHVQASSARLASGSSLSSGLVGLWTMDNQDMLWTSAAAGIAYDRSGQGNNGTLTGMSRSTSPMPGKMGQALSFNGSASYVELGNVSTYSFDINTPFTITAWVDPTTTGSSPTIFSKDTQSSSRYAFGMTSSNNVQCTLNGTTGGGDVNGATASPLKKWSFMACTYDGSGNLNGVKVYFNGAPDGTGSNSALTGTMQNSQTAEIGARTGGSSVFSGGLDDVRVYSRALSAAEVKQLYQLGSAQVNASSAMLSSGSSYGAAPGNGLVGHWTFDGQNTNWATGVTSDLSGQGFNGQLIGMSTSTSPVPGKMGQAFSFSGASTQYIDAGVAGNFTGNFTANVWIKRTTPFSANYTILTNRFNNASGWQLEATAAGRPIIRVLNGGTPQIVTANGAVPTGKWTMVTAVVTDTSTNGTKIYINGSPDTQGTLTVMPAAGTQPFRISFLGIGSGGLAWNGSIDDVRLYSRPLSSAEIKQLYQIGK